MRFHLPHVKYLKGNPKETEGEEVSLMKQFDDFLATVTFKAYFYIV